MIAKRITSRSPKPRFARLAKYMTAAEGGLDPRSWTRTADYMLCSKTTNRGEKVGGVRVTNCNTDDPAAATTLIEVTQAANTRSKTDKTYHLVFSFPPGEQPALDTLHKIEDELVASIGYADHQRISAVHIDTDHLHVHVAINKVHPKGFQNIEPFYDKKKLMAACERLEIEYGLQRTNHGLTGEKTKAERLKERQAQAEIHGGIETLTGRVTRDIAPRLKEAKSWKEAHSILTEHGLEIKLRGAGLVIGNSSLWVKASQCDRSLSFKAMTDRLGPFEKAQKRVKKPFEPKPRQNHPSSSTLYAQYQRERESRVLVRKHQLEQLKYEGAMLEYKLRQWRQAQRMLVKATVKGLSKLAMLKTVRFQTALARNNNKRAVNSKRRQIMAATASPSWMNWLMHQAQNGNTEALAVLRSRGIAVASGNTLSPTDSANAKDAVLQQPRAQINKDGSATYTTADGGVVIDRAAQIQSFRTTAGAAVTALELASKRFTGQALIVEGQDNFKREVARLAGAQGIDVRFSDPEMEKTRKAAVRPMERDKSKGIEL